MLEAEPLKNHPVQFLSLMSCFPMQILLERHTWNTPERRWEMKATGTDSRIRDKEQTRTLGMEGGKAVQTGEARGWLEPPELSSLWLRRKAWGIRRLPGACVLNEFGWKHCPTVWQLRGPGSVCLHMWIPEGMGAFIKAQDPAEGHKLRKGSGGNN